MTTGRLAALVALVAVAFAGCGSETLPPPAAEPALSPPLRRTPAGSVVHLGGMPEGIAVDPATGIVAVALRNPDELAVVDGHRIRRIRVPESARHLALERPGGPVLVPAERADAVVRVRIPSGRIESVTPVGTFPHDAASAGGRTLVTDEMASTVSILAGPDLVATLRAPLQPGGAAPLASGRVAVVGVRSRELAVYRLDRPRLIAHANAGVGPTHAAAAGGRVYVADTQGDAVLAFRLSPALAIAGRANAPGAPYGIAADAARRRLWVTLTARNELVEYRLAGPAPHPIATYPTVRQPDSVAVDPRNGRVYVAGRADGNLETITPRSRQPG